MDRREMVVSDKMNKKELILSTILKVYAIREATEKRAEENAFSGVPFLGGIALSGYRASRSRRTSSRIFPLSSRHPVLSETYSA